MINFVGCVIFGILLFILQQAVSPMSMETRVIVCVLSVAIFSTGYFTSMLDILKKGY